MARLLQSDGHPVRTTGDVAGAVSTLEKFSFDLIISDIGLLDGSGIDLLKRVQQDRPGMRSICMSGSSAELHVRASAEVGAICHLVKPVSIQKLREAIRQASHISARP
jgi:DNA-binding NtrC family response regulator